MGARLQRVRVDLPRAIAEDSDWHREHQAVTTPRSKETAARDGPTAAFDPENSPLNQSPRESRSRDLSFPALTARARIAALPVLRSTAWWCNGSTGDFDSPSPGSNPGRAAISTHRPARRPHGGDRLPGPLLLRIEICTTFATPPTHETYAIVGEKKSPLSRALSVTALRMLAKQKSSRFHPFAPLPFSFSRQPFAFSRRIDLTN